MGLNKTKLFLLTAILLGAPSSAAAQIIIGPGSCPPGTVFVPPDQCIAPSPSPIPTIQPVVLVPGMLASFNLQTILLDQEGGTWDFILPAQTVYRGLIERLEQASLDVTVAHYDWRNPAAETSLAYLKETIDDVLSRTGAQKVDIIAHSMGGLVARDYIQGPQYTGDVDQLITIGTPHRGAADAYVAREGGTIPDRWSAGTRWYITLVERTLNAKILASPIPRPESLRTFFPSLHDLLPTEPFVAKDGTQLPLDQMAARNLYLENRNATLDQDLTNADVELTTFAGTGLRTLAAVTTATPLLTEQLIDSLLNRWRDGRPDPDPPPPDSTAGDQTVLLASAQLDGTEPADNIEHDKLPEELQEEILAVLGADTSGSHIAYELPDSVLGTVVLSPAIPAVTLPDGTSISCNAVFEQNNIACQADPGNPDSPKLLVISDPLPGDYTFAYTGTGEGEYTTVTAYADANETTAATSTRTTEPAKVDKHTVSVNDGTSSLIDDANIRALLDDIRTRAGQARQDGSISGRQWARLVRYTAGARISLQLHDRWISMNRSRLAQRSLAVYWQQLARLEDTLSQLQSRSQTESLAGELLQSLQKIKTYSPPLPAPQSQEKDDDDDDTGDRDEDDDNPRQRRARDD